MLYIDLFGVFVAALSGALLAARKEMDIFGFLLLGVATGIGGGTLRDILIGAPVFWIENQLYLMDALLASCIAYLFARQAMNGWRRTMILWFDAGAMSFFAASGAMKAANFEATPLVAAVMGVMTAAAGGLLRDMMAQEIPFIFRGEIYATAALAGAVMVIVLRQLGLSDQLVLALGATTAFLLRALAIRFSWRLRTIKSIEE